MLHLTTNQERLYKEILANQLYSNSSYLVFNDDKNYLQLLILKELGLVNIFESNKNTTSFKLNKDNIRFDLCPSYKVAF